MPSWNIHLAHAKALLDAYDATALGIKYPGAFLVGNVAPDIYVGFLLTDTTQHIMYRTTHLARKAYIPLPNAERFWKRYIEDNSDASDVCLGAWAHLLCDRVYNKYARELFKKLKRKPGEELLGRADSLAGSQ